MKMERWSGRVALVTGGSSGIGAAIVRRLANHGLKVVACGRQLDRIQVNEHLTYSITCKPQLNMGQYSMGHRSSGSSNPHVLKYRQSFVIVLMYCFCLQADKCTVAKRADFIWKLKPRLTCVSGHMWDLRKSQILQDGSAANCTMLQNLV